MAELKKIPDINEMKKYIQEYIDDNTLTPKGTKAHNLSRNTTKYFTKLGNDLGFYVRAWNNFTILTSEKKQYPNDGGLLEVDLVWLTDNPYHTLGKKSANKYNFSRTEKTKSEIPLALEYEKTGRILGENDFPIHKCDELWKLSFVMARVKVLIYATSTDKIDNHLAAFREAISNIGIQQQPAPEWRVFAINGNKVIGTKIFPE